MTTASLIRQAGQTNQAGLTKRDRPTRDQLAARRDALVSLTAEAQPASVRHIYYRAVAAGLVAKNERGYEKIANDLVVLRKQGRVPYWHIVDNGRVAHLPVGLRNSPQEALASLARFYRRDPWQHPDAPCVQVWCESRSIAGVLMPLKDEYAVPIFPTAGQSSESFAYGAARQFDRPTVVLYAGDYDPAGLQCGAQLEAKLRRHADPGVSIDFRLVSITPEQAESLQAMGTKPKRADWVDQHGNRHDFHGQAIELEAIDPVVMRRMFAQAIMQVATDHVGADFFENNTLVEAMERQQLASIAEQVAAW